jgi:membrane associated rhomboid family serine protease
MFGRITPVVKTLLLINIGVFIFQSFLGLPLAEWFGYRFIHAETFQPYQIFTYMFIHAGFWHLFGNMFALFIFGPMLEMVFGSKRFMLFYLLTGLGAGVLYGIVNYIEMYRLQDIIVSFTAAPSPEKLLDFVLNYTNNSSPQIYKFVHEVFPENPDNPVYIREAKQMMEAVYTMHTNTPMVGASGSVFGILMGFGLLFPNVELMLLIPPIPIKAKYFVTLYGAYELYSVMNHRPDDNVAHLAHIGGMLFAFILIKYWNIRKPGI